MRSPFCHRTNLSGPVPIVALPVLKSSVAAPFAAYQLALHGADVIHIEQPDRGDSSRTSGNLPTVFHKTQMAHNFLAYNANKRSMTLAINTARDFGPRLAHGILPIPGKLNSDWSYAWVPIVGPLVGGLAGALFYRFIWPV